MLAEQVLRVLGSGLLSYLSLDMPPSFSRGWKTLLKNSITNDRSLYVA